MSPLLMFLLLMGGLVVLLAFGLEVAIAMGIVGAIGLLVFAGQAPQQFANTAFSSLNSFVLTAVPLFVFMGTLLSCTGIVSSLFKGMDKWIGQLPGSIACSVIGANAIFGAMCGSSLAAAATFGKIAYPYMEEKKYDPSLALGSIAVAGTLSVLIPPSIIFIVYGMWQEVSVARLFAAGLIPGAILTALLMLTVIILVKRNPQLAPAPPKFSWGERLKALKEMAPFLGLIIAVLGTIFLGIMTPTESSALGSVLTILLAYAYRKLTFSALKESALTAVKIMAMVALIMISAGVLTIVFQYTGLTDAVSKLILGLGTGKWGIFVMVCILYLVLGMFFDSFAMLLLTLPFVSPLIAASGFDFVWFGVVYVILAEIGFVTPPFGLNLFVLQSTVPQHDLMTIARGAFPFLVPMLLLVALLAIFPQLALWLPGMLY